MSINVGLDSFEEFDFFIHELENTKKIEKLTQEQAENIISKTKNQLEKINTELTDLDSRIKKGVNVLNKEESLKKTADKIWKIRNGMQVFNEKIKQEGMENALFESFKDYDQKRIETLKTLQNIKDQVDVQSLDSTPLKEDEGDVVIISSDQVSFIISRKEAKEIDFFEQVLYIDSTTTEISIPIQGKELEGLLELYKFFNSPHSYSDEKPYGSDIKNYIHDSNHWEILERALDPNQFSLFSVEKINQIKLYAIRYMPQLTNKSPDIQFKIFENLLQTKSKDAFNVEFNLIRNYPIFSSDFDFRDNQFDIRKNRAFQLFEKLGQQMLSSEYYVSRFPLIIEDNRQLEIVASMCQFLKQQCFRIYLKAPNADYNFDLEENLAKHVQRLGFKLDYRSLVALGENLQKFTGLVDITLKNYKNNGENFNIGFPVYSSNLKKLKLEECEISWTLFNFIGSSFPELEILKLHNCEIFFKLDDFFQIIKYCPKINLIDLISAEQNKSSLIQLEYSGFKEIINIFNGSNLKILFLAELGETASIEFKQDIFYKKSEVIKKLNGKEVRYITKLPEFYEDPEFYYNLSFYSKKFE